MKAQGVQLLPLLLCIVSTCWGQQVSLSLGSGRTITTNNMEILITDIGEDAPGGLPSLTCHTDLTTCCRSNADNNGMGALGQWTYPNRSVIPQNGGSANAGQQFYINRNAPKLIRLNRRQGNNPLTPTGSYCCTVPTTGGDMTICANLVPPLCFDNLPTISNGGITYNNGQATYNCFGDYRLVGDAMRTCGSEGIWGGSAPVCQQITCSDLLPTLTNGVISYSDGSTGIRPVGTTATYSCTNGYRLVGEAMRTCGSEGTWSGSAPVCQQITCSDLSTLANGDINYGAGSTNSRPVDTVATYSCNFGYTINGGSTRTCESDGNDKVWSGSPPTCQQITCSDLPTLIVSYDGGSTDIRPVDTGATYSCDTGYTINGDQQDLWG
ncbi:sushi, von Willebrand factor type A, EGF and pentraxin domain-containing protein 1-like [Halichondria panicea]|uniref:sushi, von Willebrand factor type A, EGF and pentraxin domain-containing protein 1-like n=1 Tax=Halichondria panicea TaxID=6063 RepID=UPI00312B7DE8